MWFRPERLIKFMTRYFRQVLKKMGLADIFLKLVHYIRRLKVNIQLWYHRRRLEHILGSISLDYKQYLNTQLHRTLSKNKPILRLRTQILIDKLSELTNLSERNVLCIGARNMVEINYFRNKNVKNVIGIDLYSEHADIQVMDMHQMTFPDESFDIVYACHSLEHAHNIIKVINEIMRVTRPNAFIAIELPIQFEPYGADLIDVKNIEGLQRLFAEYPTKCLWFEEVPPHTSKNNGGTSIVRAIFTTKPKHQETGNQI